MQISVHVLTSFDPATSRANADPAISLWVLTVPWKQQRWGITWLSVPGGFSVPYTEQGLVLEMLAEPFFLEAK